MVQVEAVRGQVHARARGVLPPEPARLRPPGQMQQAAEDQGALGLGAAFVAEPGQRRGGSGVPQHQRAGEIELVAQVPAFGAHRLVPALARPLRVADRAHDPLGDAGLVALVVGRIHVRVAEQAVDRSARAVAGVHGAIPRSR